MTQKKPGPRITAADIFASSWLSDDGKVWHRGTTTGTICGAEVEGEMGCGYSMVPKDRLCPKCVEGLPLGGS